MAEKHFDQDDPLGLVAVGVEEGDLDLQAACLVEEYVRLGVGDAELLALFRRRFYAGAHAIWRARGDAWVMEVIARAREQWGRPRYTVWEARGVPADREV